VPDHLGYLGRMKAFQLNADDVVALLELVNELVPVRIFEDRCGIGDIFGELGTARNNGNETPSQKGRGRGQGGT